VTGHEATSGQTTDASGDNRRGLVVLVVAVVVVLESLWIGALVFALVYLFYLVF
jgi:F0F1-type ATP synthase membrane subunit c/vacuolar-type H+-ATPase subunit K